MSVVIIIPYDSSLFINNTMHFLSEQAGTINRKHQSVSLPYSLHCQPCITPGRSWIKHGSTADCPSGNGLFLYLIADVTWSIGANTNLEYLLYDIHLSFCLRRQVTQNYNYVTDLRAPSWPYCFCYCICTHNITKHWWKALSIVYWLIYYKIIMISNIMLKNALILFFIFDAPTWSCQCKWTIAQNDVLHFKVRMIL